MFFCKFLRGADPGELIAAAVALSALLALVLIVLIVAAGSRP